MSDLSFFANPDLADGFGSEAGGRSNPHRGLDIPHAAGTPIPAYVGGRVVIEESHSVLGNIIEIAGDDGRFQGYRHMNARSRWNVGDRVEVGTIIGYVGATGSAAQGNHLCTTNASGLGGIYGYPALVSDPWPYIQAAMNGQTVASVPQAGGLSADRATYTVQSGDSLSGIGASVGVDWNLIFDANRDKISDPNLIFVGQVLTIPTPAVQQAPSARTYTVQSGDMLSTIAPQFGISWPDLYEANRGVIGDNPNLIFPGQVLTIP